ncbi:hypothetical protein CMO88_00780 [Candidatus Woesearchaeota archaeon]|nr:hypothetical protein [Candidatus Woesearchaeota archaeon]|tara:strand:- start:11628 stop:12026 length:399 start_codon:yes stop_codon:yes gene_type:complete
MKKYLIFIIGGGIGVFLTMLTTTLLTEVFKLWYGFSYAFGLGIGLTFKFLYHRKITFNKLSKWKLRLARFFSVFVVMVIVNWLLVYASTETLANISQQEVKAAHYLTTIVLVALLLSIINFIASKKWVFGEH